MDKVIGLVKDNVKVVVAVTVLGLTASFGWAKGCTVGFETDKPAVEAVVVE